MRFSRQVHYAIYGVFDLAYNGQGESVQVRVISERQSIPTRYLEQIFQRLRRAHIVTGKRGPGGGYLLTRDPSEITLGQIIEAVEGPIGGSGLGLSDGAGGEEERDSPGQPDFVWPLLAERIGEVLNTFSVAEVCRLAATQGVPRADSGAQDYQI
ncbi:MAG TPA: Rrf2 family transcriptional regulator [Myxococcales bacterium]|jgi:Rrf2 family protein|nr:Rrf2 family transcriptional regulator [Myxococcales bacterium]HIL02171.1 Rrf2 family transcriptional regulator [Myxococcales bacterium]